MASAAPLSVNTQTPTLNSSNNNHYSADERRVHSFILELTSSQDREHALSELSKIRESFDQLALLLWHSFGTE